LNVILSEVEGGSHCEFMRSLTFVRDDKLKVGRDE
jgi:hypothetical protein